MSSIRRAVTKTLKTSEITPTSGLSRLQADTGNTSGQNWLPADVYDNDLFVSQSIQKYTAKRLNIPEADVVGTLYRALPQAKQTGPNKEYLKNAMSHSVNASGAVMMMVKTELGMFTIAANSQRRKVVIQTNGACEKGETIRKTAYREFFEELGNPDQNGILRRILDDKNLRAINGINRIGTSAAEIADRIVDQKGQQSKLFLNVTGLYVNQTQVSSGALNAEVSTLNKKLGKAAKFYLPAVAYIYGDKDAKTGPANLKEDEVRKAATAFIAKFSTGCPEVIPAHLEEYFDPATLHDAVAVRRALEAIIDLSENDSVNLIDETAMSAAMHLYKSKPSELNGKYFGPAFASILPHLGSHTPDDFLTLLKSNATAHSVGMPIVDVGRHS